MDSLSVFAVTGPRAVCVRACPTTDTVIFKVRIDKWNQYLIKSFLLPEQFIFLLQDFFL